MPKCPQCGKSSVLSTSKWQSHEQLERNEDNYICKDGHEFVAQIPLGISKSGHAIRLDIK